MGEEILRFRGVRKQYGAKTVLHDVDLVVEAGEFFAFVGANGAGKTTLINGLLDFARIDAGAIDILGRPHLETASREPLAYLPERFMPPYFLNGRGFLTYMMQLYGLDHDQTAAEAMLADLDLDPPVLDKPVRAYSKGMTQKLGLAACFLSGKPILLFDEPMSGLDPKARVLLKRKLLSLKAAGRSLFFSTHLLADVEELCDRMAIIHDGRILFTGSPHHCRERFPGNTLEESFIHCIEAA